MLHTLAHLAKWPYYFLALYFQKRSTRNPLPSSMPRTAAIIVSWRRPFNMPQVLHGLRKQTFVSDVFIWHNRPSTYGYPGASHWRSDRNLGCAIRHFLALGLPEYDYFLFLDDDLYLSSDFAETIREGINLYGKNSVLGFFGRNLNPQSPLHSYSKGEDITSADSFEPTDIVKGRCHLVSWETLALLTQSRPDAQTQAEMHDDIYLNLVAQKKNKVPSYLLPHRGKLVDLPDPFSYWRQTGHLDRRDKSLARAIREGFQPPRWNFAQSA